MKGKIEGITLIALVITIIVLLILAGISIAMLTGENGIFTKASIAEEQTKFKNAEEKVKLSVMASFDESKNLNKKMLKEHINSIEGIYQKVEEVIFDLRIEVDGYPFLITELGTVKSEKDADITAPTVRHEITPEEGVTVGSVDIKIVAQDDKSGVKSIEKPDGTIENASMVTYTVTENGEYTFKIKDYENNETSYTVTITNIVPKVHLYNRGISSCGTFTEYKERYISGTGLQIGSLISGASGSFEQGKDFLQIYLKGNVGGTSGYGFMSSEKIKNPGYKTLNFLYEVTSCAGSPPMNLGIANKVTNQSCSSTGQFTAKLDLTEYPEYTEQAIKFWIVSDYSWKYATVKIYEIYLTN